MGVRTPDDERLVHAAGALQAEMGEAIDRQALHEALEIAWRVVRASNAYIDRQAPWALRKSDPGRMGVVLRALADTLRAIGTVLQPYMPGSMTRLLDQLSVPAGARSFSDASTPLTDGIALPPPQGIFPRYVETAS